MNWKVFRKQEGIKMKTSRKELNLNELEKVNGGAGTSVRTNDGIKAVCKLIKRISHWFD